MSRLIKKNTWLSGSKKVLYYNDRVAYVETLMTVPNTAEN